MTISFLFHNSTLSLQLQRGKLFPQRSSSKPCRIMLCKKTYIATNKGRWTKGFNLAHQYAKRKDLVRIFSFQLNAVIILPIIKIKHHSHYISQVKEIVIRILQKELRTVYSRYASISCRTKWTRCWVAELIHWSSTLEEFFRSLWSTGMKVPKPSISSLFAFWTRNLYALYQGRKTSLICMSI